MPWFQDSTEILRIDSQLIVSPVRRACGVLGLGSFAWKRQTDPRNEKFLIPGNFQRGPSDNITRPCPRVGRRWEGNSVIEQFEPSGTGYVSTCR
jgi:hypothetical protein